MTLLNEFLQSPAGTALIGAVLVAFADFATGVLAAVRDGTFAIDLETAILHGARDELMRRLKGLFRRPPDVP